MTLKHMIKKLIFRKPFIKVRYEILGRISPSASASNSIAIARMPFIIVFPCLRWKSQLKGESVSLDVSRRWLAAGGTTVNVLGSVQTLSIHADTIQMAIVA